MLYQGLRYSFNVTVADEGFEIGYHYDTLDRCNGDFDKAVALFEEELARFRLAGVNVQTVCSHGNPRVIKHGYQANYDIFLKDEGLKRRADILGEAYLDLDFSAVKYLSDAGIRWNVGLTTRQIEALIRTKEQPAFYILVLYLSPSRLLVEIVDTGAGTEVCGAWHKDFPHK